MSHHHTARVEQNTVSGGNSIDSAVYEEWQQLAQRYEPRALALEFDSLLSIDPRTYGNRQPDQLKITAHALVSWFDERNQFLLAEFPWSPDQKRIVEVAIASHAEELAWLWQVLNTQSTNNLEPYQLHLYNHIMERWPAILTMAKNLAERCPAQLQEQRLLISNLVDRLATLLLPEAGSLATNETNRLILCAQGLATWYQALETTGLKFKLAIQRELCHQKESLHAFLHQLVPIANHHPDLAEVVAAVSSVEYLAKNAAHLRQTKMADIR